MEKKMKKWLLCEKKKRSTDDRSRRREGLLVVEGLMGCADRKMLCFHFLSLSEKFVSCFT
jgi:hypothetical protein